MKHLPHRRTVPVVLAGLTALSLTLTACGGNSSADGAGRDANASGASGYPFTVDNCGTEVTFEKAPERIVTIKSTSIELALALGLEDKVVGTAFNDAPVTDPATGESVDVPVIAEKAPNQESVLETEPDLVYAGWESNLAADTAGERDVLAKLGVNTYVSPAACQGPDHQPDPMTFDLLFDQFAEAGRIFDASEAAEELVAAQKADLARVSRAAEGTSALWWSSGDDTPFVGGGIGAPQMVMEAAGLTNIAGDVRKSWDSLGWETIVAADPDVIILVDAVWNPAAAKIKTLESNKATAEMTAVKNKRYITIPFPAAEAGVQSVQSALTVAEGLETFGLLGE